MIEGWWNEEEGEDNPGEAEDGRGVAKRPDCQRRWCGRLLRWRHSRRIPDRYPDEEEMETEE